MLEISIIICLAAAMFLVLKNFSKTGEITNNEHKEKVSFWRKIFPKKEKENLDFSFFDEIKTEISKGQDKVIAPIEINRAKNRFSEADPETAKVLQEAEDAFLRNDLREAEDLALSVLTKDKRCAYAYVLIGKVALSRGEFEDGREAFKTAIKCNQEIAEAYFGLGQIEVKEENDALAIEYLQKAVNFDRSCAEYNAELGKAYMQVRQFAKAAKALKRASSLDIENKEYKELASQAEDKQRTLSKVWGRK